MTLQAISRVSSQLGDLSWVEVAQLAVAGAMLAVPVGSTEQHGPHLPLSTDTDISFELCRRLALARSDVLIAPPIAYGSSGEHAGFAGTLSIGQPALELLIIELCRSASDTFGHVLLVCAHGGNASPMSRAVEVLRNESRDVYLFTPQWDGDLHAGHVETSMQLAIAPHAVSMAHAVRGDTRALHELMPVLQTEGVRAISPSGILGDPRYANADDGAALLKEIAATLIDQVNRWRPAQI